jgi:phosphate transport system protein
VNTGVRFGFERPATPVGPHDAPMNRDRRRRDEPTTDDLRDDVMNETRKNYDEQLQAIKADVITLAAKVGEQIGRATRSILDGDLDLVSAVYDEHYRLKQEIHELEQRCYQVFALQQPLAVDLRTLLAIMRIIHEIQLTDSLMKNVARATRRLYPRELPPRVRGIIERMGTQALTQHNLAVDAFADSDASAAEALPDMDDVMDELQKDLFRAIFSEGAPDESSLQKAVQISFVGRDYERAADHAVTIGRWVGFIVTGHLPSEPDELSA